MKIRKIMLIRSGRPRPKVGCVPPLGLLYLISVLRQEFSNQLEIDFVEQHLYGFNLKQMRKRVKKFNPDLVGFSCLSMEAEEMAKVAEITKRLKPDCLTVIGGPHVSMFFNQVLEGKDIDIAVRGEGERTFPELIKTLLADKPLDQVKGIAFKRAGQTVVTPPREPIEDLDSIPFPAWDLVNFKRYSLRRSMNVHTHSFPWSVIFTSRGCPFHCAYCHNIFGKKTRFRSPENVVAEIELLTKKYGVKEIHIVDDIFNIDLARAKRICDLIIERKVKVKIAFPNGLRGDMMDKELIHKLKQAGCYSVTYAVETASPRLQKLIHKNLNLDKVRQAIAWSYEEGLITHAFFMLGFPSETKEEMEMTINYALNSKILIALFFTVVIYPGIELMEIAKRFYPSFDFSRWGWNAPDLFYWAETPFYDRVVTGVNLHRIQCKAFVRFYLRPRLIFLILLRFPKNLSFSHVVNLRLILQDFFQSLLSGKSFQRDRLGVIFSRKI